MRERGVREQSRRRGARMAARWIFGAAIAFGAAGCFSSSHTETTIIGPYVQAVGVDGPKLLARECTIRFDETETKEYSFWGALFSQSGGSSTEINRGLAMEGCRMATIYTGPKQ